MFIDFFRKYFPWMEKMKTYETTENTSTISYPSLIHGALVNHETWINSYREADVNHILFKSHGLDTSCGIKLKDGRPVLPLYNIDNRVKCEVFISNEWVPNELNLTKGDHFKIGDTEPSFVVPDILSACVLLQELGLSSVTYLGKDNIPICAKLFPNATFITAGECTNIAASCGVAVIDLTENGHIVKLVERVERGDNLAKLLGLVGPIIVCKPLRIALKSFRASEWLLKEYIAAGPSLSLFFSPSGLGKTFVVIDLFLTLSYGLSDWHGVACRKARCLYLCAEGYAAVIPRIQCWIEQHEVSDNNSVDFWIENGSISLDNPNSVAQLQEYLNHRFGAYKPDLIAVDTMNLFMEGDENSTQNTTSFIQLLKKLSIENNSTILLVHHTGISDERRGRGSSVIKGSLDTELRLSRSEDPKILLFDQTKNRLGKLMDTPIAFKLEEHETEFEFESGEKVTSCVLKRVDDVPVGSKPNQEALDVALLVSAFLQNYSVCPESLSISKEKLKVFATDHWKDKGAAEISRQVNPNQDTRWVGRMTKAGIIEPDGTGMTFNVVKESAIKAIRNAFIKEEAPN